MPVIKGFTPVGLDDEPTTGPLKGFTPVLKSEAAAPGRTVMGTVGDVGVTALKGAVGLPQSFVGLADIPTGGRVGKFLEDNGVKFDETQKILSGMYSDAQQAANQRVSAADGFVPTLKAALENPSTIATTAGESLPQMLGGAGIARGALKVAPKLAPWAAGALGEGTITAGQIAEQIRGENADRLLTPKQAAAAAAAGLGTGAIGAGAGKLANKLGIGDIHTLLAGGKSAAVGERGLLRNMGYSGLSEGVLEELPQSVQEQIWQNYAQGRPLDEGVGNQAAMGLLAGMATGMGGGYLNHRARPADMLGTGNPAPEDKPALGLSYNPDAGQYITYPDGSVRMASDPMTVYPNGDVTMNEEQDFLRRTGQVQGAEVAPTDAPTTENASAEPAKPSKVFSPEEQELIAMGVKPNGRAMNMLTEMKASGLTEDQLSPVITAMAQSKFGQAKKLLAAAIIDAQKATNVSPPSAPVAGTPASPVGGSPVVDGSVVAPGPVSVGDTAGSGNAVGVEPTNQPVSAVAEPAVQPAAVVETPVAEEPSPLEKLLAKRFEGSKDPAKSAEIAMAYLTAMARAPKGSKGKIYQSIATRFGLTPVAVRSYGNTTEMVKAGEALGMTADEVRALLQVGDNTKAAPRAAVEGVVNDQGVTVLPYMGEAEERKALVPADNAKTQALAAAGFESAEGVESSGFGGEDSADNNSWKQGNAKQGIGDTANAKDEAKANGVHALLEKIDALNEQIIELEESNPEMAETFRAERERLEQAIPAAMAEYQKHLEGKKGSQETMTTAEKAAEAWDKVANTYDGAPAFSELSQEQQERFIEYGPENWGESDVAMDLARIEREGGAKPDFIRQSRRSNVSVDQDGNQFESVEGPLEKIADFYKGIGRAITRLKTNGFGHTLDAVQSWQVTFDPVPWDAIYTVMDGKPTVIFNGRVMADEGLAIEATLHELAHAMEGVQNGGEFSGRKEFNMRVRFGMPVAAQPGSVIDEVLNHFEDFDSELSALLSYPLDMTDPHNRTLTANEMREEIFAQLWAFSNSPYGMQYLRDNLPTTAAFMEKVHAEVKATSYGQTSAKPGQESGQVQPQAQQQIVGRASRTVTPASAKEEVGKVTELLRSAGNAALNAVVFTEDLFARAVAKGMASAKTMHRIYQERSRMVGEAERKVAQIEELYNRIPQAERGTGDKSANRFIYDSTREGTWGFTPTWRSANAPKVKVDADMARRWNGLSKESRAWIEAVFKHGDEMLATKKQVLTDATNSEYDSLIADAKAANDGAKVLKLENAKQAQLKQFARLFAQTEYMPYAPMKRFGDFVVVAKSAEYQAAEQAGDAKKLAELEKDPDHYHVSFAESRASAMELQRELAAEFKGGEVVARKKEDQRGQMYNGLLSAFTKLRSDIDAQLANSPDSKEKAALTKARAMVVDMYLQSLVETSARKSEMRRRGVAGEIDMLRSFSTQGRADAHFLASAKYSPQMMDAINSMRRESKTGGDQLAKSDIFTEILARHNQSLTYTNAAWADRASRATSLWMLATSPGYYLQNLTQPLMLSVPFMAGRHNYLKAVGAMTKAYTQLGGLFKDYKLNESFDYKKVPADVRDVISTLVDRGRIDIGMDTELGNARIEGDSKLAKAGKKVDEALRMSAQKMEALNRVSTAMAAYRMELARTGDKQAAIEYADQVIAQTHGDYTRINAPRAFNTGMGKVALQFRKYQLIQLTLLTKLVKNSIDANNPAERAAARKALTFTLAHAAVMTGLVGMPGFAAIAFIIGKLADAFGDDDEPYNLEKELRSAIGDEQLADLILRGTPTLAGMDVSGKIGMGNALSVLPFTDFEATREGVNAVMAAAAFGAFGSLVGRQAEGVKLVMEGDLYRGLEKMMPKGVSDGMRSYREATDGVTRNNGDVLLAADDVAAWDTFQKAIGLSPASETKRRFDQNVKYDVTKAFKDKGEKIKNQFAKAKKEGDTDAMAKAREKWNHLQDSRAEEGLRREPMSMLLQAPVRQAQRERNTLGGIQFDKNSRRFVETLTQE